MKGYFYTLLITSVIGAVCSVFSLSPFEKYMRYIASLVCVVLILMPFRDIDLSELNDEIFCDVSDEISCKTEKINLLSSDMAEKRAEEYISEIVFNRFGINTVATDIKIDWENEEPTINCIEVRLKSEDMHNADMTKNYLADVLGGEVTVIEGA